MNTTVDTKSNIHSSNLSKTPPSLTSTINKCVVVNVMLFFGANAAEAQHANVIQKAPTIKHLPDFQPDSFIRYIDNSVTYNSSIKFKSSTREDLEHFDKKILLYKFSEIKNKANSNRLAAEKAILKLEDFKSLETGWDGYGAEPIDEELIEKVTSYFLNNDIDANVFPTLRKSIQIEKFIDDDNFVEVEFMLSGIELYACYNGVEQSKVISEDEIIKYFNDL
ncbi:MAG: hypothetical protein LAT67_05040 [Balneolales bacterium]|nr:hypothetical protein [Balneolales bacterium]